MKISFVKNIKFSDLKDSTPVLVITQEQSKSSKEKAVEVAKKQFKFTGAKGEIFTVADKSQNIIIVGAGPKKNLTDLELQTVGSNVISKLDGYKIESATIFGDFNDSQLTNIAFGAMLKGYRFNKYFKDKKEGKDLKVKKLDFVSKDPSKAKKEFVPYEILAGNVFLTRDLVSEPSNELNPESYATFCKTLKKDGLKIEVLGEKEMKKLGMNALLGVGQGSIKESKLVVIRWDGGKKSDKPLAFVGKGVTFDTGGISIKPSANMEDMKTDMGGSAVVVGLLRNLAQRKAKVNAVGVIGLVENMPSGSAQRPGDVVTSMSGQTIEIINTDAEGRLVLGDALHYTNIKFKPKFIIDLATLTGAIIVCLADIHAGLFSNDDNLSKNLVECGEKTGETLWRLPISAEYDKMINSDIADMKNVGSGRGAGSTTAAQFLHRFVGDTPWAHLDIAGVAWKGKGDAMAVKGASGFGVRLLDELVKMYEDQ